MANEIEAIEGKFNDYPLPFLSIDLTDSQIDIEKFDRLAQEVFTPNYGRGMYPSKYIVRNGKLYVFSNSIAHIDANQALNTLGIDSRLQSAGQVGLAYLGITLRTISQYSSTLANKGLLTKWDSDLYKMTVMQEKLSPYFEIQ